MDKEIMSFLAKLCQRTSNKSLQSDGINHDLKEVVNTDINTTN